MDVALIPEESLVSLIDDIHYFLVALADWEDAFEDHEKPRVNSLGRGISRSTHGRRTHHMSRRWSWWNLREKGLVLNILDKRLLFGLLNHVHDEWSVTIRLRWHGSNAPNLLKDEGEGIELIISSDVLQDVPFILRNPRGITFSMCQSLLNQSIQHK
jgi:hypothetical protein